MKKRIAGVIFSMLCSALPAAAEEEKVLSIYNWPGYIADDTIRGFEKETGIKVRYELFDSNETLHAKLVAGKSGYDIVVPSASWARMQLDAGLLRPLDKASLTNLANLDPALQAQVARLDPGNKHLVVWLWHYTTLGINVDKVNAALGPLPMPANAWDLVFDPRYASRLTACGISFVDSPSEVLPAALMYLGKPAYSKNLADYDAAARMLDAIRSSVTLSGSQAYIEALARGSVCVALGWSGDINVARQRAVEARTGQNIEVLVPATGAILDFHAMAIPADARHPENAHRWINYILRPEVHASLTNRLFHANPNAAATRLVRRSISEDRTIYLPDDDKKRMTVPEPLGADIREAMSRIFTKFKSGS